MPLPPDIVSLLRILFINVLPNGNTSIWRALSGFCDVTDPRIFLFSLGTYFPMWDAMLAPYNPQLL